MYMKKLLFTRYNKSTIVIHNIVLYSRCTKGCCMLSFFPLIEEIRYFLLLFFFIFLVVMLSKHNEFLLEVYGITVSKRSGLFRKTSLVINCTQNKNERENNFVVMISNAICLIITYVHRFSNKLFCMNNKTDYHATSPIMKKKNKSQTYLIMCTSHSPPLKPACGKLKITRSNRLFFRLL